MKKMLHANDQVLQAFVEKGIEASVWSAPVWSVIAPFNYPNYTLVK